MPDLIRHHLVDGNAGANVRPSRLLDAHPGEERAAGARVIAGTVGSGVGTQVLQPADDLELLVHVRQWRQCGREREVGARAANKIAPTRMAFVYVPNGAIPSAFWPAAPGAA